VSREQHLYCQVHRTNSGQEFIEATPSAELLPLSAGVQDDEADNEMGMVRNLLSAQAIVQFMPRAILGNVPSSPRTFLNNERLMNY
jgi:hypothetical protein